MKDLNPEKNHILVAQNLIIVLFFGNRSRFAKKSFR